MREGDFGAPYFILMCNTKGKRREKALQRVYSSLSDKASPQANVFAGTLLVPVHNNTDDVSRSLTIGAKFSLRPFDSDNIEVECDGQELKQICWDELNLLAPVPTCQERLQLYLDREGSSGGWLKEGLQLQGGDEVKIKLKGHSEFVPGIIKFKGFLPSEAGTPGTHFGVELLYNPGEGTTDGRIKGRQLFECPPDSGIFVAVNKVRKKSPVGMGSEGYRRSEGSSLTSPTVASSQDIAGCHLKLEDRVVWISDQGPELGTVRWIGILPGSRRKDTTIGVDFDNAVGSGTGKYRETRLFYANQNHASLVPILGLMKQEEFYGTHHRPPTTVTNGATAYTNQSGYYEHENGLQGSCMATELLSQQKENVALAAPQRPPRDVNRGPNPLYEYTNTENGSQDGSSNMPGDWSVNKPPSMTEKPDPDPDLDVGSMVEVLGNPPVYGVIRWIGTVPDQKDPQKKIAGLEMEEEISAGTDGTFKDIRIFECPPRRAFFVPLYKCRKDKRFVEQQRWTLSEMAESMNFGSLETPDINGEVSPPSSMNDLSFSKICGKYKGIQGHHNSCYLDASLFAMFYFTTVFDSIFHRPQRKEDLHEYEKVQKVLKEGIVNPLRKNHYVRADKVMKLRSLLDKLGTVTGMLSEEKDPEEFLNSLLAQIMHADPFLKLSSGSSSYYFQLFMEKDERLILPTTQQLFELSFLQSDIKLAEAPSCLILQMPRFGKDYKMYKRIVPSLELDITDVLENAPRECIICGEIAAFECKDCYSLHNTNHGTFCEVCNSTNHKHASRLNHQPKPIKAPEEFKQHFAYQQRIAEEPVCIPRQKMELFAVVCIETSHYVSFVKSGSRWVFFDSMADRKGEQMGYNIPEVVEVRDLPEWLANSSQQKILSHRDDKDLPEHIRRLLCDAYMCMYQSPDVMMFK